MKKGFMSNRTADKYVTILYFLSGLIYLNTLPSTIGTHAAGIALIIAGVYGTVTIMKGQKFLFK